MTDAIRSASNAAAALCITAGLCAWGFDDQRAAGLARSVAADVQNDLEVG